MQHGDTYPHKVLPVLNQFDEIFSVQIDGWCYGITQFPGEMRPSLVHRVIKELSSVLREAVEHNVIFDVLDLSAKISKAAKYLIHEKEVAFALIFQLPNPATLDEDRQFIVQQLVNQVERAYGGAVERCERKWMWENTEKAAKGLAAA